MVFSCIIVEDEPLAMSRIQDYVAKVATLRLLNSFDNAIAALDFLKINRVDLIFLDIEMDGVSGIKLLETLHTRPEIILTTAFEKYAIRGFDLNVSDYLLKPYTFERFLQAVLKVSSRLATKAAEVPFLFLKTDGHLEKICLDDIYFIEGMRDYRRFHTKHKKIITSSTFTDLEEILPANFFCRVHKSFIVSIAKIESITRDRIRINNQIIPISDTYKESFYRLIDNANGRL